MKRVRIVGLCLAAMFAFALVATSASAETPPEVGRCIKKAGGKFRTSGCTILAKEASEQKFEWYPAFIGGVLNEEPSKPKLKYTSKSKEGAAIQLESTSGAVIKATVSQPPANSPARKRHCPEHRLHGRRIQRVQM